VRNATPCCHCVTSLASQADGSYAINHSDNRLFGCFFAVVSVLDEFESWHVEVACLTFMSTLCVAVLYSASILTCSGRSYTRTLRLGIISVYHQFIRVYNQGCGVGFGRNFRWSRSLEKMYRLRLRLRLRPQPKISTRYSNTRDLIATVTIRLILIYRL
jgi:hypothetical protein